MRKITVDREKCQYPDCGAPCRDFCRTRGNAMQSTTEIIENGTTPPPKTAPIEERRAYYASLPRATKMNVTPAFCGGCGLCIELCKAGALSWTK